MRLTLPIRSKLIWSIIGTLSVGVLCSGVVLSSQVGALTNGAYKQLKNSSGLSQVSPDPSSSLTYTNGAWKGNSLFTSKGNQSSGTGFKHILKYATSSKVPKLTLYSYHQTKKAAENAQYIIRWDKKNAEDCKFDANGPQWITFKINQKTIGSKFRADAQGNNSAEACKKFDNKTIKAKGAPQELGGTSRLQWYNKIEFELSFTHGYHGQNTNQVRFQIKSKQPGSIIGQVGNTDEQDYGMVEAYGNKEDGVSIAAGIPFSRECTDVSNAGGNIKIYDADTIKFGSVYVQVLKRLRGEGGWTPLKKNEYGSAASVWDFKNQWWELTGVNNDNTRTLHLNEFRNDSQYLLLLDNKYSGSYLKPTGNVLSYELPGEAQSILVECEGWQVEPKSQRRSTMKYPGETLSWKHWATNIGTDKTDRIVNWRIRQYEKVGDTIVAGSAFTPSGGTGAIPSGKKPGQVLMTDGFYSATNADIGKKICQRLTVSPSRKLNGVYSTGWSVAKEPPEQCIQVRTGGNFVPSADIGSDVGEPKSTYYWSASVTDGNIPTTNWPGPPPEEQTTPSDVKWEVHKIVYPHDNSSTFNNGGTGEFSCPSNASCSQESSPPGHARRSPNGLVEVEHYNVELGDLAAGSRVCYVSSVYLPPETEPAFRLEYWYTEYFYDKDWNVTGSVDHDHWVEYRRYVSPREWRHSDAACITVAKKPRVQVWNGDLLTQGEIVAGTSRYTDNRAYGSWGEYGVLSGGYNHFLGSGAPYTNGSTESEPAWSPLTFANTLPDGSGYGKFALLPDAPQIAEYYQQRISSASLWPGGNFTGKSGLYQSYDDVIINSSSFNVNDTVVLYVHEGKTVRINEDIRYRNGSYTRSSRLPQVIIIADNITIAGDVNRIDAWLITAEGDQTGGGSINTCSDVSLEAKLTTGICDKKLQINGPVITSELHLRRTHGARNEDARGEPAEIFNLRPDAYLWVYRELQGANTSAKTVDIVERPPRF